jgi:hypothetical protein
LPTNGHCTARPRGFVANLPARRKCLSQILFRPSCESGEKPELFDYNE